MEKIKGGVCLSLETFFDDYFTLMMFRLITAVILCGLIGFEREIKNRSAGFRTHILVGVGACVMMLLSLYGFDPYLNKHDSIRFDPARIPSYVISGIGFLGAGTIMVHGITIRGLTTAASIWTVAGLGLIIGAGMYGPAVLTTVVVLLSLILLNNIEKVIRNRSNQHLQISVQRDVSLGDIVKVFDQYDISLQRFEIQNEEGDQRTIYVEIQHAQNNRQVNLFDDISKLPYVRGIYHRN